MTWKPREIMLLHRSASAFVSLFLHDLSWSLGRKWGTSLLVSAFTFMGPVFSSIVNDRPSFEEIGRTLRHPRHRSACHDYLRIRSRIRCELIILTYLLRHFVHSMFSSCHSLWTVVPQSAQRGIWALACDTNGKSVVPRYTLCMSSVDINQ